MPSRKVVVFARRQRERQERIVLRLERERRVVTDAFELGEDLGRVPGILRGHSGGDPHTPLSPMASAQWVRPTPS